MDLLRTKDFYSGVALATFGFFVTLAASRFDYLSEDGPGPGFLPLWLGLAICALAVSLIVNAQRHPAPRAHSRRQSWSAETRALSSWLALMVAIFLSSIVGFAVSLMLLTVFIIGCMERRSLSRAIVVGLGLGIGFHIIFVVVLGLSLPANPLGF